MRHFTKMIFLWGMMGLIIFGCEEDELQSQINALEFKLIVLDEDGNEKSVFEANTDITLGVRVNNKSEKDFLWAYSYDCQLIQQEEFLLIYKKVNSSKVDSIGKPYPYPINCLFINLPPDTIPAGSALFYRWLWSANPDNQPLGPGKYFTEFHYTLNLGERSKNIDLKVKFEMK